MTPDSETLIEQLQCVRAATPTQQAVVDDAITALRAVQWRPISEAPKDGREVLLRGGRASGRWTRVGYWAQQSECWSVDTVVPLSEPREFLPLPAARASKEG